MKPILSWLFIMACPFMLGGVFPVVLMKYTPIPDEFAILDFVVYSVIWFWVWAGPFDEGRRLSL